MSLFTAIFATIFGIMMIEELFPWISALGEARLWLSPVAFFTASLFLSFRAMLTLAFLHGFLRDALHVLIIGDYAALPLGTSIFLLGAYGSIAYVMRPFFHTGKWGAPLIVVFLATTFMLSMEYFTIHLQSFDSAITPQMWRQIFFTCALSSLSAPLFMFWFDYLANKTQYPIRHRGVKPRFAP